MAKHSPDPDSSALEIGSILEVKYSLPDLLREMQVERAAATFSMEKLDQLEIAKMFQGKKTRRAKPKK